MGHSRNGPQGPTTDKKPQDSGLEISDIEVISISLGSKVNKGNIESSTFSIFIALVPIVWMEGNLDSGAGLEVMGVGY